MPFVADELPVSRFVPDEPQPGVAPAPPQAKPAIPPGEERPLRPETAALFSRPSQPMSHQRPAPTGPTFKPQGTPLEAFRAAAQVPEFITTEMVGMVGSTVASALGYGFARSEGKSRKEAGELALGFGAEHSEQASAAYRPLTTLINYFAGDPSKQTPIDVVMHKVMDAIKGGSDAAERKTGGVVKSEEVQILINALMSRFAVSGLNRATSRWDGRGPMPKDMADRVTKALEEELAKEKPDAASEPSFKESFPTLKEGGFLDQYGKPMAVAAGVGVAGAAALSDEDNSRYLVAMAALPIAKRMEGLRAAIPEGSPLRSRLEAADRAVVGYGPSAISHLDQLRMDLHDAEAPKELLAAVDATVRDLEKAGDSKLKPMIVPIPTGLDYLLVQTRDKLKEAELLGGFLTIGALARLPEATPLSAIHPRLRYTSRFLERLNSKFGGTWDFSANQLRQELKKSGAPAAEVEMFERIIGDRPRITAKDLVGGFKIAAGDFELTADTSMGTSRYEPYGLERIDRLTNYETVGVAQHAVRLEQLRTAIDQAIQAQVNSDGTRTIPDFGGLRRVRLEELEAEYAALEGINSSEVAGPPARTIVWQSPLKTGTSNHFSDPNYFAHSRSFDEGGVRHVVELQSDLVQKAGKMLSEGERAGLERGLETLLADHARYLELRNRLGRHTQDGRPVFGENRGEAWPEVMETLRTDTLFADAIRRGENNPRFMLNRVLRQYEVQIAENRAKLGASASVDALRPLFPEWYKRIVREEIADAARLEGQSRPTIRFATADTVAKVEGWPDSRDGLRRQVEHHTRLVMGAEAEIRDWVTTLETGTPPRGSYAASTLRAAPALSDPKWLTQHIAELRELLAENKADLQRAQEALDAQKTPNFGSNQLLYDRYRGGIEKFLKSEFKARPHTDSHGHTWLEIDLPQPPSGDGVPTRLLGVAGAGVAAGLAATQLEGEDATSLAALLAVPGNRRAAKFIPSVLAIGAGAALTAVLSDEEKRVRNSALAGAVVGLGMWAKSRSSYAARVAAEEGSAAEALFGSLSAELRTMSQPLLRRLTEHEKNLLVRTNNEVKVVAPFVEAFRALPAEVRKALDFATLLNNRALVTKVIQATGDKTLIEDWPKVQALLDRFGADLKNLNLAKELLPDYYPRIVSDLNGLMKYLGKPAADFLGEKISEAAKKKTKAVGEDLTEVELSQIVNSHLIQAIRKTDMGGQSGLLKNRTVKKMTEDLLQFYAPASESLPLYIRSAAKEIERARFFGKDLAQHPDSQAVNVSASIGNVVARERAAGNLTNEQLGRLESLLRSRFGPGEKAAHPLAQAYKNITQALLLGNPFSAIVQFGDAAVAVALQGFLPSIKAVAQSVGKKGWTLSDMGLVNHLSEEFVRGSRQPLRVGGWEISTAAFLDKTLRLSGFSFVDEFSKLVNINAAANKFGKLAKSESGRMEIARQYGEYFGADTAQLIDDLARGKKSSLVGELLFRELSDVQPISKLEMPQAWVHSPNARVLYTLKSFMIRQMNLVRERGIREIAKGDIASVTRGTNFLLRYSLALGLSGAGLTFIQNWLLGKDDKLEWGDIPENIFKTFGWSSYVLDNARKKDVVKAAAGTLAPPYEMFGEILTQDPKAMRYIPLVGKWMYTHSDAGQAAATKAKRRKELKEDEIHQEILKYQKKAKKEL